ncbi:MAG: SHOCT domain-containing protein [Candidatus Harrisonbacteria bacterium]|nr:SHOCT domain-containing protein [Candidatus Harrisonbacteria bacterium]
MWGYGYPGYGDSGFGWGMGVFGFILMVAWWVLVIAAVVWFAKWLWRTEPWKEMGSQSALNILKERYVKGEIDKKEFEEKKKELV